MVAKILGFLQKIFSINPNSVADITNSTDTVVMISPDYFQFNPETAETNKFQNKAPIDTHLKNKLVMQEFNQMVETLRNNNIRVITLPSPKHPPTPDAVFPNNWFSVHAKENQGNVLILYPMLAESRRNERQPEAIIAALQSHSIPIDDIVDLTAFEKDNLALEGTGSMVFDRISRHVFVALSPRTSEKVLVSLLEKINYTPVIFRCYDSEGIPIYHTNVMMSIGTKFAVIAADTITNSNERNFVLDELKKIGKEIIYIDSKQMKNMAGNILEMRAMNGKTKIILSDSAYNAFTAAQREKLSQLGDLIMVKINLIEEIGGGSVRCMLAEIFY